MRRARLRVILVAAIALAVLAAPAWNTGAQHASPPAKPGLRFTTTVTVDDRRLGLTCAGSGSPTVVLVGGLRLPAFSPRQRRRILRREPQDDAFVT
jgi:hypothetical protein